MKTYTTTQLLDLAIVADRQGRHAVALWLRRLTDTGSITAHSLTLTADAVAVIESI